MCYARRPMSTSVSITFASPYFSFGAARLWPAVTLGLLLLAGCGGEADVSSAPPISGSDVLADGGVLSDVALDSGTPIDTGMGPKDGSPGLDGLSEPDGVAVDGVVIGEDAETDVSPDVKDECSEGPYGFLCPCIENDECQSGICIGPTLDAENPYVCTETCITECPNDWPCKALAAGGADVMFICIPQFDTLCEQCVTDADCGPGGDLCMDYPDGRFCGRDCSTEACPEDYRCDAIDAGGLLLKQCVPETDSCLCGPEIDYASDVNNCVGCGLVCSIEGATAGCGETGCFLLACNDGFYNLNGEDGDGCEYECTPDPVADTPNGADTDCDGIDGSAERALFVSVALGSNGNDGSMGAAVASMSKAFELLADSVEKDQIYVAAGTYEGQLIIPDGVQIFGGFSPDGVWDRDLSQYETVIVAEDAGSISHVRTVIIDALPAGALLDGLTIRSGNATVPGASSYGIWISDVSDNVLITGCRVVGGSGAGGAVGLPGAVGKDGAIGIDGTSSLDTDCFCDEFDQFGGPGGAGGASACINEVGKGGIGADGACDDANGLSGNASPEGTAGGAFGDPGAPGANGDDGDPGVGGNTDGELTNDGLWTGRSGTPGEAGTPGKGGGGGSSGKGTDGGFGCASWGGGGGGGGSAGCTGFGGAPGQAGGGSFGIFVVSGTPRLEGNVLVHRNGGAGGAGAPGGKGGEGKPGGLAGTGNSDAG
ncbi:MAG: hypothetical protein ACI9OJ_003604, partial [Myxococcota bacterium]